ncbi:MAG: glycerophosphodiester phosphodiesterase family protein [Betaproteobacteria bacterium]
MLSVALRIGYVVLAMVLLCGAAWVVNASWWSSYTARTTVLAHRGLHQTYSREGVGRETCTADRIRRPEHGYLENTIDSMEAAFALGADVIEFDIHPTTDGQFAVFHDWTLDCRTNGKGVTRQQSMAYLETLDIGHGYTADGGATYPFRGKFVGSMPTLEEVLARFPDKRFLINIKSRDRDEGRQLAARLKQLPAAQQARLMSYGGDEPEDALAREMPQMRTMGRNRLMRCMTRYAAYGWTGIVPQACHHTLILVPQHLAPLLWGWPNRFVERMHLAGSEVYLRCPYGGGSHLPAGIDTVEQLNAVPKGFPGGIWTDRIDLVAEHWRHTSAR